MLMNGDLTKQSEASLYIHIPFCTRKCDYCHFYVLPDKQPLKTALMEGLQLEWQKVKPLVNDKQVVSIYFGGGTPYLLGAKAASEILGWFAADLPASKLEEMEITLEANPENIELEGLQTFRSAGINRLSIGLQSLDDTQLATLSRQHSALKGIKAIETASQAGFENISIDLMYDLPGQTLQSWQRTVERACRLPITHLSLYNLTIEPHTVFFKYKETLTKRLPDEEISKAMYETACEQFEKAGLGQYEISAFAKPGYASRHNSGYWTGRPFLGLGPSAFSYWDGRRYRNFANLSKYLRNLKNDCSPEDFSETLEPEAKQRELLAIALRLLCGVHLPTFQQINGPLSRSCLHALKKLVDEGYIHFDQERFSLSKKGILFYDSLATELIL